MMGEQNEGRVVVDKKTTLCKECSWWGNGDGTCEEDGRAACKGMLSGIRTRGDNYCAMANKRADA